VDQETRESFAAVFEKLDQAIATRTRLEEHTKRGGGYDIHHIPPCAAFREFSAREETAKENRTRNFLVAAGIVAGLTSTAIVILSKVILGV